LGLVDFSRLAREFVARSKEIGQKNGGSNSIEMLDAFRYGKINTPLGQWSHSVASRVATR
jgi:hypothetical protein